MMKENNQAPRPLDDKELGETTGGTFFGLQAPIVTMENPIFVKDQLEETICTRCGKIRKVPVNTTVCSCGGSLKKYTKSTTTSSVNL